MSSYSKIVILVSVSFMLFFSFCLLNLSFLSITSIAADQQLKAFYYKQINDRFVHDEEPDEGYQILIEKSPDKEKIVKFFLSEARGNGPVSEYISLLHKLKELTLDSSMITFRYYSIPFLERPHDKVFLLSVKPYICVLGFRPHKNELPSCTSYRSSFKVLKSNNTYLITNPSENSTFNIKEYNKIVPSMNFSINEANLCDYCDFVTFMTCPPEKNNPLLIRDRYFQDFIIEYYKKNTYCPDNNMESIIEYWREIFINRVKNKTQGFKYIAFSTRNGKTCYNTIYYMFSLRSYCFFKYKFRVAPDGKISNIEITEVR